LRSILASKRKIRKLSACHSEEVAPAPMTTDIFQSLTFFLNGTDFHLLDYLDYY
jgi:hypothetical protein